MHFKQIYSDITRLRGLRFLTLTIPNTKQLSQANVKELRHMFAKFRRHKGIKNAMKGGLYCIEATNIGNGWHLHLHCLYSGFYIPHKLIQKAWQKVGGGPIVGIEFVRDSQKSFKYLLKDMSKLPKINTLQSLGEYACAIKDLPLFISFGKKFKKLIKVIDKKFKTVSCPKCGGDMYYLGNMSTDEEFYPDGKGPPFKFNNWANRPRTLHYFL